MCEYVVELWVGGSGVCRCCSGCILCVCGGVVKCGGSSECGKCGECFYWFFFLFGLIWVFDYNGVIVCVIWLLLYWYVWFECGCLVKCCFVFVLLFLLWFIICLMIFFCVCFCVSWLIICWFGWCVRLVVICLNIMWCVCVLVVFLVL